MRPVIEPKAFKGRYNDEIKPEDLIIMGDFSGEAVGRMELDNGILRSLWRLSLETGLGMTVDIRRIMISQKYLNECNRADINPYEQPMDGCLYISRPASEYHLRRDITVIGYMTKEKVCRIINGDRESYLGS